MINERLALDYRGSFFLDKFFFLVDVGVEDTENKKLSFSKVREREREQGVTPNWDLFQMLAGIILSPKEKKISEHWTDWQKKRFFGGRKKY